MTLSFTTIKCERCEAQRQTRFACPDCGKAARATETDPHTAWRQRAVGDALRARSEPAKSLDVSPEDLIRSGRLADLPARLFRAGDSVGREDTSGPDELTDAAGETAELDAWSRSVKRLRPMVAFNAATAEAVRNLVDVFDIVVDALEAKTIPGVRSGRSQPRSRNIRAARAAEVDKSASATISSR